MIWPFSRFVAAVLMAASTGACAGGPALPALPDLPGTNEPLRASGRVTDVYMRVAHGASECWFGAAGVLKATHIFHADLDPPSKGERAVITVQEIDRTQVSPWGRRVFRIQLTPADGATAIAVDNIAMPEEVAKRMRADVFQWIEGKSACSTKEAPDLAPPATTSSTSQKPRRSAAKPAVSTARAP